MVAAATGELQSLAALLLARPVGANLPISEHPAYDAAVLQVVREEEHVGLPVVANLDFGHTDPMWTLPMGGRVRIDLDRRTITSPMPVTSG